MIPRIFGLETELPLAFAPDAGFDGRAPTRRELFERIVDAIRERVAHLPALARKEQAIVLQNGSLLHYEFQARHANGGLLEWATAECADPLTLLAQSKSQERLLGAAIPAATAQLRAEGIDGDVQMLKNNVDAWGNNWGCHESYSVDDGLSPWGGRARTLGLVLFWIPFLPLYILPHVIQGLLLVVFVLVLVSYVLLCLIGRLPVIGILPRWLAAAFDDWLARHGRTVDEALQRWLTTMLELLYLPFVRAYSVLCRALIFRRHRAPLATFLATRQIYTGAGRIHPTADGLFWLSQKAEFTDAVQRVFWNERGKPLIDVKQLLLEPLAAFRARKRLHLLAGDANLCEVAEFLKLACTGLVLELIEAGARLPLLRDPLDAVRQVALDPALCARLELTDGRRVTALEIQHELLDAARTHVAGLAVRPLWTGTAIALWGEVLERLAQPESLAAELDWVAKRQMMSQLLWDRASWRELDDWAPALALLVADGPAPAGAAPDAHLSARQRAELERRLQGLSPARMGEIVDLYWSLKKMDLRYHELSDAGYHRALAREGLTRRVLDDERVERAVAEPPTGTRARLRGEFVALASGRNMTAYAGWTRLKAYHPRRVLKLPDPFDADPSRLGCFGGSSGSDSVERGHPGV